MARLGKAYRRLTVSLQIDYQRRLNDKRDWERNKNRRLEWHDRQPQKTQEEYDLFDKLVKHID